MSNFIPKSNYNKVMWITIYWQLQPNRTSFTLYKRQLLFEILWYCIIIIVIFLAALHNTILNLYCTSLVLLDQYNISLFQEVHNIVKSWKIGINKFSIIYISDNFHHFIHITIVIVQQTKCMITLDRQKNYIDNVTCTVYLN